MPPGFRVVRELSREPGRVVLEAEQEGLGRRVALELASGSDAARVAEGARRQAALDHPGVVPVFAAGRVGEHAFVARRHVGDVTLASARGDGAARLAGLAAALRAAHAAGLVHGRLAPWTVPVDEHGRAVLDRLVPGGPADLDADRQAFAHLARLLAAQARRRRARRPVVVGAAVVVAVATGLAGASAWREGGVATRAFGCVPGTVGADGGPAAGGASARRAAGCTPPPVAPGATALGSDLAPGGVRTVDCLGAPPGTGSPACTLQPGALVVPRDGVVRRWAVGGARGDVALQVLRPARGGSAEVRRSPYVPGAGEERFAVADVVLPVRRGDRLALELTAGAGVAVRSLPGAGARRWTGPLAAVRGPRAADPEVLPGEVQLRVDLGPPGPLPPLPRAPGGPGRDLVVRGVELPGGAEAQLALVVVGRAVVAELRRPGRAPQRRPVAGADARGTLLGVDVGGPAGDVVRVRWAAPGGGPPVVTGLRLRASGLDVVR